VPEILISNEGMGFFEGLWMVIKVDLAEVELELGAPGVGAGLATET